MKKKRSAMIAMVLALVLFAGIGFGCSSYDDIVDLSITSANLRVAVEDVQAFNPTVTGVRRDGKLVRLTASDYTLDMQENITEPGRYPLTITYKRITKEFSVSVIETVLVATFVQPITDDESSKDGITPAAPGTVFFHTIQENYRDQAAPNWSTAYNTNPATGANANYNNMRRQHDYGNIKLQAYSNGRFTITYDYLGYRLFELGEPTQQAGSNNVTQTTSPQVGNRVTTNAVQNVITYTNNYVDLGEGHYVFQIGAPWFATVPVYQDWLHATILRSINLQSIFKHSHINFAGTLVDGIDTGTRIVTKLVLDRSVG